MAFFTNIAYLLFGSVNSDSKRKKEQRRQLKILANDIKHNRYHKFYKTRKLEVTSQAGLFFFDIYKTLYPLRNALEKAEESDVLKDIIIEYFMEGKQQSALALISPETIRETSPGLKADDLSARVEKNISIVQKSFDGKWRDNVDQAYKDIVSLLWFVSFDYYGLLRKFAPGSSERDILSRKAKFAGCGGGRATENLKDFMAIVFRMTAEVDWSVIFNILMAYKGAAITVSLESWSKLLAGLQDVMESDILLFIIRHSCMDIAWASKPSFPKDHIAVNYINKQIDDARDIIEKIVSENQKSRVDVLARSLFGEKNDIKVTINYTASQMSDYADKGIDAFVHAKAFHYTAAFLFLYMENLYAACQIFVLHGTWLSKPVNKEFTDALYELVELRAEIIDFDKSLSENGSRGKKLVAYKSKPRTYLKEYVKTIDGEAYDIIFSIVKDISIINRILKNLIDDRNQEAHMLVKNWDSIEVSAKRASADFASCCQHMGQFTTLMGLFPGNYTVDEFSAALQ